MHVLNRRRLLKLGLASLVAAPFARLLSQPARADTGGAKRFLVLFSPNGTVHKHWRPTGSETSFSFGSGSILEPLAAHKDDLIVMDGLSFTGADNHEGGMAAMLTAQGETSIDQHLARAIGGDSRFSSLELGVQTSAWGGTTQTRMSYLDGGFVTPDDDPQNVWKRLFGDVGDESQTARRQSVLDLSRAEVNALRTDLGAQERILLDAHLAGLEAVERSLSGESTCESPTAPDLSGSEMNNDLFPEVAKAQLDLAVLALACGSTKVASVQLSHTVGPTVFTWLGESEGHHSLSHIDDSNQAGIESFVNRERWFAEQVAYVLDQLKAQIDPETGGSMLDSTVVLWAKELGDGREHVCTDVPWVLAGNAGGFFNTGRYLSLGDVPHDQVLTSICHAFGMEEAGFGAYANGPLEALR